MSEDSTTLGVKFERALCAVALCWEGALDQLPVVPDPDEFLSPGAPEVWAAILQCRKDHGRITVARVSQIVNENGANLVAAAKVANMADPNLCSPEDAQDMVTWIKARTLMHRAMQVSGEFQNELIAQGVGKAPEVIDRFARHLHDVANGMDAGDWDAAFAADVSDAILKPDLGTRRIPTGWVDVDAKVRGWPRGKMSIIAARPSMGKSLVGISACRQLAARGLGTGLISMEMDESEVWIRMACDMAFVNDQSPEYESVQAGKANAQQMRAMSAALAGLRRLPVTVNDRSGLRIPEIHRWARRLDRHYRDHDRQLDALFIDYLQLAKPDKDRRGNKVAEVTDISADIVAMAKDLGVAVVALSQLSRATEHRGSPRPILSDLRESGALEQDADMVGMLFRPAYYFERKAKEEELTPADIAEARQTKNHLDIDWQKNRNGKTGITKVFCAAGSNAIRDLNPFADVRAA